MSMSFEDGFPKIENGAKPDMGVPSWAEQMAPVIEEQDRRSHLPESEDVVVPHFEASDAAVLEAYDRSIARLEEQAQELQRRIDAVSSDQSEKKTLKTRLEKAVKRMAMAMAMTVTAYGIDITHFAMRRDMSRYTVTESVDENEMPVYQHEDPQTTAVIDFLSGKEDMPEALQLEMLKREIIDFASTQEGKFGTEEEILALTRDGVEKILTEILGVPENGIPYTEDAFPKPEYSRELYEVLWKIEQESGNPKVRFLNQESIVARKFMDHVFAKDLAHYRVSSNTIYLELPVFSGMEDSRDQFLAEAAHGKQFKDDPFSAYLRGTRDLLAAGVVVTKGVSPGDAYQALYEKEGSVEFEAHQQIEIPFKEQVLDAREKKYIQKLTDKIKAKMDAGEKLSYLPGTIEFDIHWELVQDEAVKKSPGTKREKNPFKDSVER